MHLNMLPNRAHTSVDMCHVDIYTLRSSPSQILLPAYLRVYHVNRLKACGINTPTIFRSHIDKQRHIVDIESQQ